MQFYKTINFFPTMVKQATESQGHIMSSVFCSLCTSSQWNESCYGVSGIYSAKLHRYEHQS